MSRLFYGPLAGLHLSLVVPSLALTCVASPVLAGAGLPVPDGASFSASLASGLISIGLLALAVGLVGVLGWLLFDRREPIGARRALAAILMVLVAVSPALAAEIATEVQTPAGPVVVFSWGPWVTAIAQMATEIIVPLASLAFVTWAYKTFPLASMFLREELVERTLRRWLDAGVAATREATKDSTLNVNVGSTVVANALQRGLDRADADKVSAYVWKTAGGPEEVAKKITRMLKLEPNASGDEVAEAALLRAEIPRSI